MKKTLGLIALVLLLFSQVLHACTGLKLSALDGSVIHGRTAEFGVKLDLSAIVIPRNYLFSSTTPLGSGLSYRSKYAIVGASAYGSSAVIDGINEKGLSAAGFYFPQYADYTPTTPENQSRSLSPVEFTNWVLTQFATIEELKSHLNDISIAPTILKSWGPSPPPFHYIVYDKSGASVVIEPLNGTLKLYENRLGVVTNSPTFDWHITNLNNFVHLTPYNVPPVQFDGMTFIPFGQGSGMSGLPGDFSPPSRFVRAAVFSVTAIPPPNAQEAILQTFHLLNSFDIPVGIIRTTINGVVHTDTTLATAVRDPQALRFYYKTYEDQTIKMIDLNEFDLNATSIKSLEISGNQTYLNVSAQLK